jgi:hypothetical protein
MTHVSREVLARRWLHSHEEDTETERVYRPASYAFPPSRGRSGFELKPDGTCVDIGIAAIDGPAESAGHWEMNADGAISIRSAETGGATHRLTIVSATPERLVVKS